MIRRAHCPRFAFARAVRFPKSLRLAYITTHALSRQPTSRPSLPDRQSLVQSRRTYATQDDKSVKKCQFCGATAPLPAHVCPSCQAPSPIPESVSFYAHFPNLLAPPNGPFDIDVRALRRDFLQIQQKCHPDKFSHDDKQRMVAEGASSLLNKAYTTLQHPLSRAEYILSLNGVEMEEGESLTDSTVLMTVMEAQETIEEASSVEDLDAVKNEARDLIAQELHNLASLFGKSQWQEAKKSAIKLRYWLNIQKSANDWEPGSEVRLDH